MTNVERTPGWKANHLVGALQNCADDDLLEALERWRLVYDDSPIMFRKLSVYKDWFWGQGYDVQRGLISPELVSSLCHIYDTASQRITALSVHNGGDKKHRRRLLVAGTKARLANVRNWPEDKIWAMLTKGEMAIMREVMGLIAGNYNLPLPDEAEFDEADDHCAQDMHWDGVGVLFNVILLLRGDKLTIFAKRPSENWHDLKGEELKEKARERFITSPEAKMTDLAGVPGDFVAFNSRIDHAGPNGPRLALFLSWTETENYSDDKVHIISRGI